MLFFNQLACAVRNLFNCRLRQELGEKDKALKEAKKELDEGDTLLDQFLKDTAGQRESGTPAPLVSTSAAQGTAVGSNLSLAMGSRPSSRNLVISSPILQGAGTYSDALNKSLQHTNSITTTTIPVTAAKVSKICWKRMFVVVVLAQLAGHEGTPSSGGLDGEHWSNLLQSLQRYRAEMGGV